MELNSIIGDIYDASENDNNFITCIQCFSSNANIVRSLARLYAANYHSSNIP